MGRQSTTSQRRGGEIRIRRRREKVSTECEEDFGLAIVHRVNRPDSVEAMISRWLEIECFAEAIEKCLTRSFPDADSTIALHVAVAAHRAQARARLSDLTTQQHQVYDLLYVRHCVAMLRQAHGPTEDRTF